MMSMFARLLLPTERLAASETELAGTAEPVFGTTGGRLGAVDGRVTGDALGESGERGAGEADEQRCGGGDREAEHG